jgi:hypothetical protein
MVEADELPYLRSPRVDCCNATPPLSLVGAHDLANRCCRLQDNASNASNAPAHRGVPSARCGSTASFDLAPGYSCRLALGDVLCPGWLSKFPLPGSMGI